MMQNTAIVVVGSGVMSVATFFMGVGGVNVAETLTGKQEPYYLQLANLEFKDGKFHQHIIPHGKAIIRAEWSAKVTRDNHIICVGGGPAPYDGQPIWFTPDEWTGDDCPELKKGDRATASWEWKTNEGYTGSIAGEIIIGEDKNG